MTRRWTKLLGLVLVLVAATGCQAGIPRSGQVYPGETDRSTIIDQSVVFSPDGPAKGASPEEIVRGFVLAASSATNDYAVARQFLAGNLVTAWDPHTSVVIDSGRRTWREDGDKVFMTASPVSTVDARGAMRSVRAGNPVEQLFSLVKEGGEWRVNAAPDGIVLDERTFAEVFTEHALYFLEPQTDILVPDERWFLRGAAVATRIVTELLVGPSELLSNKVTTTAFPSGTVLTASVPLGSNAARIDLSREALSADERQLRLMLSQVEASLTRVAGVTRAEISVNQTSLISGPADPSWAGRYPKILTRPLVIADGLFGEFGANQVNPIPRLNAPVIGAAPVSVVVSPDRGLALVKTAGGVEFVGNPEPIPIDTRAELIDPVLDAKGFAWSVPRNAPLELKITTAFGLSGSAKATWIDASSIKLMSISRDGTRLVVVYDRGGDTVLAAVGVVRDDNGIPTALTEPLEINVLAEAPIDLDWVDESSVALAEQAVSGGTYVTLVTIGGQSQTLTSPQGVLSLAGANASSQLRVLGVSGDVLEYRGATWQSVASRVSLLAKQG